MFVPFVERTARYLSGADRLAGARVVDTFVQLRDAASKSSGSPSVDVVGPGGQRPLSLTEAATAQSFPLAHAGFYQIRYSTGPRGAGGGKSRPARERSRTDSCRYAEAVDRRERHEARRQRQRQTIAQTNSYQSSLWWWGYALFTARRDGGVGSRQPLPGYAARPAMSSMQRLPRRSPL